MALASHKTDSVVALSQSPFYHYQYSSIADAIDALCREPTQYEALSQLSQQFCMGFHQPPSHKVYHLNSDTTTLLKAHSPTLQERSRVYVPNTVIAGNKPLGIGYRASTITLSEYDGWQLTLSMKRLEVSQSATECLLGQLSVIFSHTQLLFAKAELVVNRLDRAYGNGAYLAPSYAHKNLVSIVRLRQGQKVWMAAKESPTTNRPPGRTRIYCPTPHYLQPTSGLRAYTYKGKQSQVYQQSIFDAPHSRGQVGSLTGKGRRLIHTLQGWDNILLRTKGGHTMSDKPLTLVGITTHDAVTGEAVFREPMLLVVSGLQKGAITLEMAFDAYLRRYGIEPFFRFNKQQLLLDSFQTPDRQHLDNWLVVVQLAVWLLYLTAHEAGFRCAKWQAYCPRAKTGANEGSGRLSLAQARKSAGFLFLTFPVTAFLPHRPLDLSRCTILRFVV